MSGSFRAGLVLTAPLLAVFSAILFVPLTDEFEGGTALVLVAAFVSTL